MNLDENILQSKIEEVFWETGTGLREGLLYSGGLNAVLWKSSLLSGGLRLRKYRAVAGNHKLSSRFTFCACFCGRHEIQIELRG